MDGETYGECWLATWPKWRLLECFREWVATWLSMVDEEKREEEVKPRSDGEGQRKKVLRRAITMEQFQQVPRLATTVADWLREATSGTNHISGELQFEGICLGGSLPRSLPTLLPRTACGDLSRSTDPWLLLMRKNIECHR